MEYALMAASITAEPNPANAQVLPGVRLFAILSTWMEADIVEATVRNAFAQGCERVYLVDNDSPDDTIAIAVAAGAILARTVRTERIDLPLLLRHINEVVGKVSASEPDANIWWL